MNRGASFLEQLFALLLNGCSAECAKLDALFISPRQPKRSTGANDRPGPSMVGYEVQWGPARASNSLSHLYVFRRRSTETPQKLHLHIDESFILSIENWPSAQEVRHQPIRQLHPELSCCCPAALGSDRTVCGALSSPSTREIQISSPARPHAVIAPCLLPWGLGDRAIWPSA